MPIIINGGSRSAGGWWARHLGDTKTNERAEVIEITGLSAETMPGAFREMAAVALGTHCTNYFYQANINPRADERLTPAQWREAVDTLERNLGLTGQPRFVIEHEKEGRTHRHVVWSRIDAERMTAISDSLTAVIHERTSRELEIKFDLERGKSILVRDRDTPRPERRPKKHETFRAAETGIDLKTVKAEVSALWRSADNGPSFKAALEASGYVLARGDRRDFVIIDRAGDDHSLARRAGAKAAEVRERMKEIDPASLPGVEEARALQKDRAAERATLIAPQIEPHVQLSPPRDPANQNEHQLTTTFEAIRKDPWQAIYTALPKDADRTLLAAVALCAEQCEKYAAAEARISAVIQPELAQHYRDRQADAGERRQKASQHLAALPPEQVAQVSPLFIPAQVYALAHSKADEELANRPGPPPGDISAEKIAVNPWSIVFDRTIPADASDALLLRINKLGLELNDEAWRRRDEASFTHEEKMLWNAYGQSAREVSKDAGDELFMRDARRAAAAPEFSRETIAADPWTAVYLPIPEKADEGLLSHARAWASDLKQYLVDYAASRPTQDQAFDTLVIGVGHTRAENIAAADARLTELETRLERMGQEREDRHDALHADFAAAAAEHTTRAPEAREPPEQAAGDMRQTAQEMEAAIDHGLRGTARLASGLAKAAERLLSGVFSFFVSEPKATPQQARDEAKAATNEETLHAEAVAASKAERAARLDDLLSQIARTDAEQLRQRRERGDNDEVDRGHERERER